MADDHIRSEGSIEVKVKPEDLERLMWAAIPYWTPWTPFGKEPPEGFEGYVEDGD